MGFLIREKDERRKVEGVSIDELMASLKVHLCLFCVGVCFGMLVHNKTKHKMPANNKQQSLIAHILMHSVACFVLCLCVCIELTSPLLFVCFVVMKMPIQIQ